MNHISTQSKPDEIKLPEIKKNQSENNFAVIEGSDDLLYDAAKLVVDYINENGVDINDIIENAYILYPQKPLNQFRS